MHALLLAVIALGVGPGSDAPYSTGRITQSSADIYQTHNSYDVESTSYEAMGLGHHGGGGCESGNCGGAGVNQNRHGNHLGGWFGHMPQTCYSSRYGCYYGGNRYMSRYPAFHGTYYRRPYNYRNLFDYPWHAEMHEPTSMFSYNTLPESGATNVEEIQPQPSSVPTPSYEATFRGRPDATNPAARPTMTLRR